MENIVLIDDVFKTSRGLPENYIYRKHVDELFLTSLTKGNHIVIYGSSKQGKTSVRKKNLLETDYITVMSSNNWTLGDLHEAILKQAGYEVKVSEQKTLKGTNKVNLSIKMNDIGGTFELSNELAKQINRKNIEFDPENVNDVITALKEINFNKYIVIEDFHYLDDKTKVDFSIALKAFHEESAFTFIIVGVWLDDDKLTTYNGDLTGRIISINADIWTDDNFRDLISESEALLNISYSETFKEKCLSLCNGNVFLLQQICHKACSLKNIFRTQEDLTDVGDDIDVSNEISQILEIQSGRFNKFLMDFSIGFGPTELELYKWIVYILISVDDRHFENGLPVPAIRREIQKVHPKKDEVSDRKLIGALNRAVQLQCELKIKPIIIEFDGNRARLKVVDKSFLLWKKFKQSDELFDLADIKL